MKILVTGNPSYQGLAQGIYTALNDPLDYEVEFIGRHNGWDLRNFDLVADYAKDFDVFINSLYIPNQGQAILLDKVYEKFKQGHIINISSTVVYWDNGEVQYNNDKSHLEKHSKKLSNECCWNNSNIKVSCIAYGPLDSESKKLDTQNKISLIEAGNIIKFVIESSNCNINYLVVDPIQIKN